jgi:hypothetical protein
MSKLPASMRLYNGDTNLTFEELNQAHEEIVIAIGIAQDEWKREQLLTLLDLAKELIRTKAN